MCVSALFTVTCGKWKERFLLFWEVEETGLKYRQTVDSYIISGNNKDK